MELKVTSEDLGIIKTIFDSLPKDGKGTLEVIAEGNEPVVNPSWSDITGLYKQYRKITLEYTRSD